MSYCRWSSDDFNCDLYCYEDVSGGFTTHIARRRILGDIPKVIWPDFNAIDQLSDEDYSAWANSYRVRSEFIRSAESEPIDLPLAGETFNDPDLEHFRDRLLILRGLGYRFPNDVIDAVDEEIAGAKEGFV